MLEMGSHLREKFTIIKTKRPLYADYKFSLYTFNYRGIGIRSTLLKYRSREINLLKIQKCEKHFSIRNYAHTCNYGHKNTYEHKFMHSNSFIMEYFKKHPIKGYLQNMSINTSAKCEHNRPDIVVWDRGATVCSIREIDSSTDLKII